LEKRFIDSETVEKVPKQILRGDAEKNDFTDYATINDLTIMKGHETPKNHPLSILMGSSIVSADTELLQEGTWRGSIRFLLSTIRIQFKIIQQGNGYGLKYPKKSRTLPDPAFQPRE
jgi:hypothetical protein